MAVDQQVKKQRALSGALLLLKSVILSPAKNREHR